MNEETPTTEELTTTQSETTSETPGKDNNESGQTVQGRQSYFEIAESEGKYYWTLWSGNGRQLAVSAIGYTQMHDCKSSIGLFNGSLGKKLRIVVVHD